MTDPVEHAGHRAYVKGCDLCRVEPEVPRRPDEEARRFYVDEGSDPSGLAAARIGIEHVEHHGQPLRFVGSSYPADTVEHRFRCPEPRCPFVLAWRTET